MLPRAQENRGGEVTGAGTEPYAAWAFLDIAAFVAASVASAACNMDFEGSQEIEVGSSSEAIGIVV